MRLTCGIEGSVVWHLAILLVLSLSVHAFQWPHLHLPSIPSFHHPRQVTTLPSQFYPRDSPLSSTPDSAATEALLLGYHGGYKSTPTTATTRRAMRIAHGSLMATAFTLLFPVGAMVMRLSHNVRWHAGIQGLALACVGAGMGIGVWLGVRVRYLDYAHTIIGLTVVTGVVVQGLLGGLAHGAFRRVEMKRGKVEGEREGVVGDKARRREAGRSVRVLRGAHRWWGRTVMVVGIVNGGLGLMLAQNSREGMIAYSVVAGVVWLVYIGVFAFTWYQSKWDFS